MRVRLKQSAEKQRAQTPCTEQQLRREATSHELTETQESQARVGEISGATIRITIAFFLEIQVVQTH